MEPLQVSDLAWLGTKAYDNATGNGAIGVEFAGTAVTSGGQSGPIEPVAGNAARAWIQRNEEMGWQEGYYRGYFYLTVTPQKATAQYYGMFPVHLSETDCIDETMIQAAPASLLATAGTFRWPTSPWPLAEITCSVPLPAERSRVVRSRAARSGTAT